MTLEQSARRLEALGNPTRLALFRLLVRAGTTGLPVGQIQERIGVPGSTLSHHLHRLVANGLVTQERRGTVLVCRADYGTMRGLIGFLLDECCVDEKQAAGRADAEQGN